MLAKLGKPRAKRMGAGVQEASGPLSGSTEVEIAATEWRRKGGREVRKRQDT